MLLPKKVKHRKWQTGRLSEARRATTKETRGTNVSFGAYGLKSTAFGRITSNQLESSRKVISRTIGKTGKLWIRVFPDRPFTVKAAQVPMGNGKGDPEGYCTEVKSGRVLFEVDGVTREVAMEALRKGGAKLPVKTKILARE
jgi:large subunit ribosomal protein L16